MSSITTTECPAAATRRGTLSELLRGAWRAHCRRRRQRVAELRLRRLDEHLLRDIGIDRGDISDAVRGRRR
jgi:uncharacterized protein YjiS (DUF1127 family)